LSYNNGASFWNIATGLTDTNMLWTVLNNNVDTALIRVVARDGGGAWISADESDASFQIMKAGTTVLSPNGGETFTGGTMPTISWTINPFATTYDVRLSYNNGASFWNIATGLTDTNMLWTVLNNNVDTALIRVVARDGGGAWISADDSDGTFTIVKP
jgi:hypothetical protein